MDPLREIGRVRPLPRAKEKLHFEDDNRLLLPPLLLARRLNAVEDVGEQRDEHVDQDKGDDSGEKCNILADSLSQLLQRPLLGEFLVYNVHMVNMLFCPPHLYYNHLRQKIIPNNFLFR